MTSQPLISKLVMVISLVALGWLALEGNWPANGQVAVRNQGFVPYDEAPINYRSAILNDPVARLQKRIEHGTVTLKYEPVHGYLKSVLEELTVPIDSQTLVFSKTSFQYRKISPQTPRALYFNDDVYVGWVRDGKALEVISFDPQQGAIFYIVDDPKPGQLRPERPSFQRAELDCTQCHVASSTRGVPGALLRSVFPNPSGTQATQTESFITGHESPFKERWGGWYVTGTHGRQTHMGNVVVRDREHPEQLDRAAGANVLDLSKRFDTSPYLTSHSDIVAHLVLAHQTQMHNLITLTNYRTRLALHAAAALSPGALSDAARRQYEGPAEELLRYLLFVDEVPLEDRVTGSSAFTEEFAARGPRDSRGRSLRDFDLRTRIFKYPCSYLVYSEAFDALPEPAKTYLYRRLLEVLTGRDQSSVFTRLTTEDRRAILEILLETKPGLPKEWNQYDRQIHQGEKNSGRNGPGRSIN
ncbi:MAG TPA: hypothetical protein VJ302_01900 [Blastocatellia bacterium]|nr:hypothetical protein [Blastocatellia bacterium]